MGDLLLEIRGNFVELVVMATLVSKRQSAFHGFECHDKRWHELQMIAR